MVTVEINDTGRDEPDVLVPDFTGVDQDITFIQMVISGPDAGVAIVEMLHKRTDRVRSQFDDRDPGERPAGFVGPNFGLEMSKGPDRGL